jgi:hypothetical protein
MYSLDMDNNGIRQGARTSRVIPFRHPNGLVVKQWRAPPLRPKPVLCLDAAKLTGLPAQVKQALDAVPAPKSSVSFKRFYLHQLRLPYGRWITEDRTEILYNRRYQPLFVWRAGADKPERCDPHWIDGIAKEGWFYSDGSSRVIGRTKLWHALNAVLDAWERGDRAAAGVLEKWLLSKHLAYGELTRAYSEDVAQRRKEREFLEDFENMMNTPAKSAKPPKPA